MQTLEELDRDDLGKQIEKYGCGPSSSCLLSLVAGGLQQLWICDADAVWRHSAGQADTDSHAPALSADTQQRLTLHIRDLGAREKAIHAQLAALNEEAGSDLL